MVSLLLSMCNLVYNCKFIEYSVRNVLWEAAAVHFLSVEQMLPRVSIPADPCQALTEFFAK